MRLVLIVFSLIFAALGASCAPTTSFPTAPAAEGDVTIGHAVPSEMYQSVESAIRASDGVVIARVVAVRPGRSVTAGGITLPFTNVSLSVVQSTSRGLSVSSTILVEQTGGMTPQGLLVTEDDPQYQPNELYALILRKTDIGYRSIAPLGRFRILSGPLQPTAPSSVASSWSGRSTSDLMAVASSLGK